jgi:hypothetical protein
VLPSNGSVIRRLTCLSLYLFGLSLADLQLFTSQITTHKPVACILVLNCGAGVNWTVSSYYWTKLVSFGTRYITSAPTTHRKLSLYCWNVCTNHCTATVAALINCWAGCCLATNNTHSYLHNSIVAYLSRFLCLQQLPHGGNTSQYCHVYGATVNGVQGVLPIMYRIINWKAAKVRQRTIDRWIDGCMDGWIDG